MKIRDMLWSGRKQKPRNPLKTTNELAVEFGVSGRQLRGIMSRSVCAPSPKIDGSDTCSRKVWYDPVEMRMWWKTYCQEKIAPES